MFEEMLAFQPGSPLLHTFSELLAADLDDEAHDLYARMSADIGTTGAAARRPLDAALAEHALLEALAAAPSAREDCWRRLYRRVDALLFACSPAGQGESPAIARLRHFVLENPDLGV